MTGIANDGANSRRSWGFRHSPGSFEFDDAVPHKSPMDRIVTLTERKTAEAARRQQAVESVRAALTSYARAHDGRFLLFGSAARGTMRYDSGVDILVDFPPDALDDAWSFAEQACWERRLDPDITPFSSCKGRFRERVTPDLLVLA
jgi:predicted nucleotidyltransferase